MQLSTSLLAASRLSTLYLQPIHTISFYVSASLYRSVCACVCVRVCVCVCVCVYVHLFVCVYIHIDICRNIYESARERER